MVITRLLRDEEMARKKMTPGRREVILDFFHSSLYSALDE